MPPGYHHVGDSDATTNTHTHFSVFTRANSLKVDLSYFNKYSPKKGVDDTSGVKKVGRQVMTYI